MFSYSRASTLIGVICCLVFVQNLVLAAIQRELILYYMVNVFLYGTVSILFLRHVLSKKNYLVTSQAYFWSFMGLIYFVGNVWNLIFWFLMPGRVHEACDSEADCISSYRHYGFAICLVSMIASAYFNNCLYVHKEQSMMEYDRKRIDDILISMG